MNTRTALANWKVKISCNKSIKRGLTLNTSSLIMKINSFKWQNCLLLPTWQTNRDFRILLNLANRIIPISLIRAKTILTLTSSMRRPKLVTTKCWLFKIHLTIIIWICQWYEDLQTSQSTQVITSVSRILDLWAWARATVNLYQAHSVMNLQW